MCKHLGPVRVRYFKYPLFFSHIILPPANSTVVDVLQTNHCGSAGSLWLGKITQNALPEVGQQRQASACYGVAGNCCAFDVRNVTVLSCPGFFVYFLYPTDTGMYIRYCATPEN